MSRRRPPTIQQIVDELRRRGKRADALALARAYSRWERLDERFAVVDRATKARDRAQPRLSTATHKMCALEMRAVDLLVKGGEP
jgi:thiamine biosynthesis protein ThiC